MANKVYTVKSGDSLWAIAQKNNTTVSAILKANPTIAKRRESGKVDIFSGSKVKLPGTGGQGTKKAAPARSADEARARATQKSNAAAMARYQRMQTEKKRDAAAASRGGTKKITAKKPSRVPEELRQMGEGMKKGLLAASMFIPAARGGRAAVAAISGKRAAAVSKGRPAIGAAAAPRAIGPGPVGKRIAVQEQRIATLQANIKRASASRRTKNPNTTAGELQKMREQLRLEKEQLKRLQNRFGGK